MGKRIYRIVVAVCLVGAFMVSAVYLTFITRLLLPFAWSLLTSVPAMLWAIGQAVVADPWLIVIFLGVCAFLCIRELLSDQPTDRVRKGRRVISLGKNRPQPGPRHRGRPPISGLNTKTKTSPSHRRSS